MALDLHRRKNKIIDNPNTDARVGFLIWSPFHFYVYKNIFKYLPSEYIVGAHLYRDLQKEDANIRTVISFLNEKRVNWRWFDRKSSWKEKNEFMKKYSVIVSVWSMRSALRSLLAKIPKVRVLYGNAKDVYNFGFWTADFDLALSYGRYSDKYLSQLTKSVMVGNPKFDDWFGGLLDEVAIGSLRLTLDPGKKTVLYLPTHNTIEGMSAMKIFENELDKLTPKYNILVKLHYLTVIDEPDILRRLSAKGIVVFDEKSDILDLLKICDVVLSDNSGAIFDAILADKPVILFKSQPSIFMEKIYFGPRRAAGMATYPGSLEQKLKLPEHAVGPVIGSLNEFSGAIKELEKKSDIFSSRRRTIRDEVFEFQDGGCGKRAAQEIEKIIIGRNREKSDYPFFHYVARRERLLKRVNTGSGAKKSIIGKIAGKFKSSLGTPGFNKKINK